MNVYRLPALSDNYIFLLHDPDQQVAAVVDPAEAPPVLRFLEKLGASLTTIFNTHHHGDHVGGNSQLLRKFPDAVVYGGECDRDRIPKQTVFLKEGDTVEFGGRQGQVFFVPGHTRAHIAYYFPAINDSENDSEPGELFCGDTLFAGGCGRLFEGTPAQMVSSLTKLRQLPNDTRIWCAHEYTLKNLQFAITVDPDNMRLQQRIEEVKRARQNHEATVPSMLGLEKQTNPFLRWDERSLQTTTKTSDPVRTFAKIRGMKDLF